ncbi:hypothetical protein TI04_11920, partial [Achromatium sp. WMS2]
MKLGAHLKKQRKIYPVLIKKSAPEPEVVTLTTQDAVTVHENSDDHNNAMASVTIEPHVDVENTEINDPSRAYILLGESTTDQPKSVEDLTLDDFVLDPEVVVALLGMKFDSSMRLYTAPDPEDEIPVVTVDSNIYDSIENNNQGKTIQLAKLQEELYANFTAIPQDREPYCQQDISDLLLHWQKSEYKDDSCINNILNHPDTQELSKILATSDMVLAWIISNIQIVTSRFSCRLNMQPEDLLKLNQLFGWSNMERQLSAKYQDNSNFRLLLLAIKSGQNKLILNILLQLEYAEVNYSTIKPNKNDKNNSIDFQSLAHGIKMLTLFPLLVISLVSVPTNFNQFIN